MASKAIYMGSKDKDDAQGKFLQIERV